MYRMVLTQIFRWLICAMLLVTISSCSMYRLLEIEILKPSKISLEANKSVALIDRQIRQKDSPLLFQDSTGETKLVEQFKRGMNSVFSGVEREVINSWNNGKKYLQKDSLFPVPFYKRNVQQYAQMLNVDYLLSVELLYYQYNKHKVTCNWLLRLYQSDGNIKVDSLVVTKIVSEIENIDSGEMFEELKVVAWEAGEECAKRICPYWVKTARRVYTQGTVLRLGDAYIQENNIEQATELLEGALKSQSKLAIKAGINLAWLYENQGHFEIALNYLKEAEQIAQQKGYHNSVTTYLHKYLKMLEQRVEQQILLDQQLPIE